MKKLSKIILPLLIVLVLAFCWPDNKPVETVTPGWPEITYLSKPWARWWWLGSSVDSINLSVNMAEYARAGLGGLEITPVYGVKGQENNFISYTSKEWMDMLMFSILESKRLGLGIDLALASGWPFGGPWVEKEDACKYLQLKEFKLSEGHILEEKIEFIEKPLVRIVGKRTNIANISDPIATNDSLQYYAFDQVRFPGKLPLVALMAYSDQGEILNLLEKVESDGTLNWKPLKGNYTLIAAFMAWHGKMVERAGPGGEGDVIDHFSKKATENYLSHFEQSFEDYDIAGIRAFFNDSYEVDDAFGESNWTQGFFEAFEKKRGYDLKNYLPLLLAGDSEQRRRLMCDYRETISDLLLEEFTIPWKNWASTNGKIIRNQAHGSPANILDLYASSDIPETEGIEPLNIKFASSAAHISGKKLVSAEAATWLDEHFLANLSDAKQNIDRYLVNGVNHIVYHGTPYSPAEEPWPGRMFYASEHFAPTNTLWKDFPALNSYVARAQSFLQRGKATNDILLYFPIYDQWMEPGKSNLQHFHGASPVSAVHTIAQELNDKGYCFDFISDKQIQELSISGKEITTSGNIKYKTLIVPPTNYIPLAILNKIIELSNQGANILFVNHLPGDVPGLSDYSNRQEQLNQSLENLHFQKVDSAIQVSVIGKGSFIMGNELSVLLQYLKISRETMVDSRLKFIRLNYGNAEEYFVSNWTGRYIGDWIPFNADGNSAVVYNLMTGEYGSVKTRGSDSGTAQVYLQLEHGESYIVQFWKDKIDVAEYTFWQDNEPYLPLNKNWSLKFIDGGPVIPQEVNNFSLVSWTEIPDENANYFSGTAVYTTSFDKPDISAQKWKLQLGEVFESASIKLNGKELGTLIGPNYSLVFDAILLSKKNVLEISVTNLMANRIIYMDKHGIAYRNFYNVNFAARLKENQGTDGKFTAVNWIPLKSGLIGPVQLIPQKQKTFE